MPNFIFSTTYGETQNAGMACSVLVLQAAGEVSESAALTEGIRPEALDERQIEDLIAEHLQQHLEILPEQDLANALHEFVDKVPFPSCQSPEGK